MFTHIFIRYCIGTTVDLQDIKKQWAILCLSPTNTNDASFSIVDNFISMYVETLWLKQNLMKTIAKYFHIIYEIKIDLKLDYSNCDRKQKWIIVLAKTEATWLKSPLLSDITYLW